MGKRTFFDSLPGEAEDSTMRDIMNNEIREYASEEIRSLLAANDLNSLDAILAHGEVIHRRYDAKSVSRVELRDEDKKLLVYIKRQWRPSRIFPRFSTVLAGNALKSYPLREKNGLDRLRHLGLFSAEPLAFFRHRWHPFKAAVVTRAVPGETTLYQMIENGTFDELDHTAQETLIMATITVIRTIHDAGLGWRSMNIKHFYPVRGQDGSWTIWLIDCEGIFSPAKPRHVERERRSVLRLIRRAGNGRPGAESFARMLEEELLNNNTFSR